MTTKKKPDNRTRVQKIKLAQADAIRAKFKGMEYVRQLELSCAEYDRINADLKKAITHKKTLPKKDAETLFIVRAQIEVLNAQITVQKAKVDLNLRRLKYCVPELKSVELTTPGGENLFDALATAITNYGK